MSLTISPYPHTDTVSGRLWRLPTERSDRNERTETCFERLLDATPAERASLEDEIVRLNIDFADRVALRFSRRGVDREDLVQIGRAALVAAMRRYRPGSGRCFTSFAGPTIRGELKHYFRDATWSVRPPRRLQELRADVHHSRERLEQGFSRTVTNADVAADLDLPETDVRECLCAEAGYHSRSLDAPTRDAQAGSSSLSDLIAADGDEFARMDDVISVRSAMAHLDDRERQIVRWRYVEGCTQAEIGQRLGVSQMQVSRLHRAILKRLREVLERRPEQTPRRRALQASLAAAAEPPRLHAV
ncbi:MAG: sigma-70 family RNA polymerase sigma factor [Intrasporangium sp.]|uniref:sigma-70 family RNA polymerase sigma factor n=1 Tax=Intrasporangium sp. TaxID=1925024 RepID=UPI002648CF0A|nr:sigma-70 family RNA polymerase sigma factor [Intrasporangium sp.]MDN5798250.1 sigma-70 family RNA polymerase sigma factor [Intrasporangium sp.]